MPFSHVSPLERLRMKRGVGQKRAAQMIGISDRQLRTLEKGEAEPSGETIFHLASFYGVDPAKLLEEIRAYRGSAGRPKAAA